MLKRVLYDYIKSFRWKNIARVTTTNPFVSLQVIIYALLVAPWLNEITKSEQGIAYYYFWAVPLLVGMVGMENLSLRLPQIMFLCPMNRQERKQYIRLVYWIRIMLPVMLQLFAGVILTVCRIMIPGMVVMNAVGTFSVLAAISIIPALALPFEERKADDNMISVACIVYAVICALSQMAMSLLIEEFMSDRETLYGIVLIMIFLMLGCDIMLLKRLPKTLEKCSNYEEDAEQNKTQKEKNSGYVEQLDMIKPQNQPGKAR